ncbi:DUF2062 domain-containing protein [Parahaliea sp. F7430]|uniref:DUF2062 domain-containing protein n=1 Tax=Sediminihaliea albiluteola TaxID=2758564 RepID=A0A7W2TUI5_9GAMM|nr:DUF2062 domain-containing protein [Sediminihaliea albiluteola]MBA6412123.1 DUF2062 domain-containing protein [Sediminihaliea albiluteola]
MPKHTLKQLVPSPARIREIKALGVLGEWIYESNLWHINRYSASMAFFVGLFVAFVPLPGQMVIAALLAILLRCNLPISISLIWVTNPLTMPPIFYMAYKVGALLIDVPVQSVEFDLSWEWLSSNLLAIWEPFLLGCLICGLFFGSMGYFIISMLWRWRVVSMWKVRAAKRKARTTGHANEGK